MKRLVALFLLGAGLMTSATSYAAGKIVFDPTNFGKNTLTAMQTAQSVALESQQYATQIKQYMMYVQDLKALDPATIAFGVARGYIPDGPYATVADIASAAHGVYSTYGNVRNTMDKMETVYRLMNDTMMEVNRAAELGNMSPEKVLAYDAAHAKADQTVGKNYYNQLRLLNGELQTHQKRSDALAAQIPKNKGTVDSLATIASQNTLLSDQLTHLISIAEMQAAMEARRVQQEGYDREMKGKDGGRIKEMNKGMADFLGSTRR